MLSGESFAITKCRTCSFLFTNPRPTQSSISRYYNSYKYISHTNKVNSISTLLYKIARYYTLSVKVSLINSITKNQNNILDFGCGTGEFLHALKKYSWKIYGFEPDINARNQALRKTTANIYDDITNLKNLPPLDIIALWHVLEHVHELNETIEILKNKLNKNGRMVIAVPNQQSFDAKYYQEFWAAYDVPRHLYHFSMKTMKQLLLNHGLKIYKTIPMKLDAFYISLLSENYKTNRQKYVKSFITGYRSNIYASKNKNNYSSIIYIAGK